MNPMLIVKCFKGETIEYPLFSTMDGAPIIPSKGDFVVIPRLPRPDSGVIFCFVEKIVWLLDKMPDDMGTIQVHALECDPNTGVTSDGWTVSL